MDNAQTVAPQSIFHNIAFHRRLSFPPPSPDPTRFSVTCKILIISK